MSNNLLYLLFVGFIGFVSHLIDWVILYKVLLFKHDKKYIYIICIFIYLVFPLSAHFLEDCFIAYFGLLLFFSHLYLLVFFIPMFIIHKVIKYFKNRKK